MSDSRLFPIPDNKPSVKLVGEDGNAFSILGRTMQAMRRHGWPKELIDQYTAEATSGDYNHLLATTLEYVDEDEDDVED